MKVKATRNGKPLSTFSGAELWETDKLEFSFAGLLFQPQKLKAGDTFVIEVVSVEE